MNFKILTIPVFLIGVLFAGQISDSFGHGLGSETMPPVMIEETEATLEVNSTIFPRYITATRSLILRTTDRSWAMNI